MPLKPFDAVVTEHGPTVLRVCRAVLGSNGAEDAWSETFLAALRAYPELDPAANVEAWLVTIAKRKAIDHQRKAVRTPLPLADLPDTVAPENISVDRDDQLWSVLRSLPLKQREALAYRYVVGLPFAQIANILGNSEGAARRAASDGLKKLRTMYQLTSNQEGNT